MDVEELAQEHTDYMKGLLQRELDNKMKLYKEAFIHGYKHGKKERE